MPTVSPRRDHLVTKVLLRIPEAGALAGMDVAVATPPGFEPDGGIVGTAERRATAAGGMVWTSGSRWATPTTNAQPAPQALLIALILGQLSGADDAEDPAETAAGSTERVG